MKIETYIKKVNRYFVDKLINKEYELKEIDHYCVSLIIDNKYRFVLWIANEANSFRCYNNMEYSYMLLEFSVNEQQILHKRFNDLWQDARNRPDEIARRRKEYQKLKTEFEPGSNPGQ